MIALYRKYRPEKFCELVGQEHTRAVLQAEVANNLLAHAYLFVGPRGTGKTSTARILAAAVNCGKSKGGEPCTVCDHCKAIRGGRFLDLIEIDAASQTGVDNVRENIIESAKFVPQMGKFKIYLIDEAHMLSTQAWNALLKTLEEPPERIMFIFATTEPRKIPDTILSRCQQFRFKPVAFEVLKTRLQALAKEEGVAVEEKVIDEITLRAGGYIRDAESLLGQALSLGEKKITWKDVEGILGHTSMHIIQGLLARLLKGEASAAVESLETLREEGVDLHQLPGHLIDLLRAVHFKALTGGDHPLMVKRYGSEGLTAVGEMLKLNANAHQLRRALNAVVERIATARDIPSDLLLEILFAELAEIFNKTNSETVPLPPSVNASGAKQSDAERHPEPAEGFLHSDRDDKGRGLPRCPDNAKVPLSDKQAKPIKAKAEPIEEKKEMPKHILKLELQAIKDLWSAFVDKVNVRNRALPFILRSVEPLRVSENHLHLGVHYQFHYERLAEAGNRRIVEETLEEFLGGPVVIQLELLKGEVVLPQEEDHSVSQLINLFGGKVVEG